MSDLFAVDMSRHGDTATIDIHGAIGGAGSTAAELFGDLKSLGQVRRLDVHIHSPGGSVLDGIAIYEGLRSYSSEVHTYADGLAASMASVILLAAPLSNRHMVENGWVMIHNPAGKTSGNAQDLRRAADFTQRIQEQMVGLYVSRTSLKKAQAEQMMEAETWLDAEQAVSYGFVSTIENAVEIDVAAVAAIEAQATNMPKSLKHGSLGELCASEWKRNPSLREKFFNFEGYSAFCRHENKLITQ